MAGFGTLLSDRNGRRLPISEGHVANAEALSIGADV